MLNTVASVTSMYYSRLDQKSEESRSNVQKTIPISLTNYFSMSYVY